MNYITVSLTPRYGR